jgi:hypothetical protein
MSITNYDGAIVTTPREHVHPKTVEELQNILRRTDSYPSVPTENTVSVVSIEVASLLR